MPKQYDSTYKSLDEQHETSKQFGYPKTPLRTC